MSYFLLSVGYALEILKLNAEIIHRLVHEERALRPALFLMALGTLARVLGLLLFPVQREFIVYRLDAFSALTLSGEIFLAQLLFFAGVAFFAEKIFKINLSMRSLIQVMGHASCVNLLAVIPFLAPFAYLWLLVVLAKVLITEGGMKWPSLFFLLFFALSLLLICSKSFFYGMM